MELAGLEPGTFDSLQLYLTTTRLRLMTSLWWDVFYLMPFPRKIHRQTPLKMIEPRKTALLIVKKTTTTKTERISWQHEWKNIRCMLHEADTPRLRSTMQNICLLISISAVTLKLISNSQNHIHFWFIQVLKNSMTWYLLTFRPFTAFQITFQQAGICIQCIPPLSWEVEEKMPIFSSIQSRS